MLVGTVADAAGGRAALRRFQYACNPLAILVSGLHGQAEPACLLFPLPRSPSYYGRARGLRPPRGYRWHPAATTPSQETGAGRGIWLAVNTRRIRGWQDPLWLTAGSIGTKAAVVAALLAVWWWRRAHPLDIATATTTALVALTPSFGTQYLLWQAPSATARPTRLSIPLQIVLGTYAAMFYLPMVMLHYRYWKMAYALMMLFSLFVIAFMIAALPWRRRQWRPGQPPQHPAVMRAADTAAARHAVVCLPGGGA